MFPAARNDYQISLRAKQRGIALLVMLAMILVAFTTIAISRLSVNSAEQKVKAKTTQALIQSRDAIMAFALAPTLANVNARPPGTLPCPDGDANGLEDPRNGVGDCPQRRGLVPFRTLNIPQPIDGTGAPIWYVVANEYSRNLLPNEQRNSSSPSTLRLNVNFSMAFILLAPNKPILMQVRVNPIAPLAGHASQFLEGENANNSLDSYTNVRNDSGYDTVTDTQNDQVLAMPTGEFWSLVEGVVLKEVGDRLRAYRDSTTPGCGNYPWAAPGNSNAGSASNFSGRLPLTNWNITCAAAPAGWVTTHWNTLIFYAICDSGVPIANPPLTPCLEIDGDGDNNDAQAIIISPGLAFGWQTRVAAFPARADLFEGENNSPVDNVYSKVKLTNHSGAFNDLIYVVR